MLWRDIASRFKMCVMRQSLQTCALVWPTLAEWIFSTLTRDGTSPGLFGVFPLPATTWRN